MLPPDEVTRRAVLLTVVTGSSAVLYLSFGWSNVHTPIYIALYASSLDLSRGSAAAKGILQQTSPQAFWRCFFIN